MRLYLVISSPDGTQLPNEVIQLPQLPAPGTALRPPLCKHPCFVLRAVPASIEATGDIRIAGTVYADLLQ